MLSQYVVAARKLPSSRMTRSPKAPLVGGSWGLFCFEMLGDLDRGTDYLDCILPVPVFGQVVCLDHDAVGVTLRQAVWNKEVQFSRQIPEDFFLCNSNPVVLVTVILTLAVQRAK